MALPAAAFYARKHVYFPSRCTHTKHTQNTHKTHTAAATDAGLAPGTASAAVTAWLAALPAAKKKEGTGCSLPRCSGCGSAQVCGHLPAAAASADLPAAVACPAAAPYAHTTHTFDFRCFASEDTHRSRYRRGACSRRRLCCLRRFARCLAGCEREFFMPAATLALTEFCTTLAST